MKVAEAAVKYLIAKLGILVCWHSVLYLGLLGILYRHYIIESDEIVHVTFETSSNLYQVLQGGLRSVCNPFGDSGRVLAQHFCQLLVCQHTLREHNFNPIERLFLHFILVYKIIMLQN
jgi:hypothetical protein